MKQQVTGIFVAVTQSASLSMSDFGSLMGADAQVSVARM